jgi:hypothetical protein
MDQNSDVNVISRSNGSLLESDTITSNYELILRNSDNGLLFFDFLEPFFEEAILYTIDENTACSKYEIIKNPVIYNFPNPFNPSTTIQFETTNLHELPRIEIYNLKGQKVNTLPVPESQNHQVSVVWDGTDQNNNPVASGIYLYRLKAGDVDVSKKCLLLK